MGSSHSIRRLLPPAGEAAGRQSPGIPVFGNPAQGSSDRGMGSQLEEVTVPALVFGHACCMGSGQDSWAVPWWAICQVQAGIRLTGGPPAGFGRLLQFGANVEMLGRSAVS